jgi:serine/threonine-protein kinase HipA
MGTLTMDSAGRLELSYDHDWQDAADATPLSLSMPLSARVHGDAVVRAFIWNLLPDNERVLERWARTYRVSAGNPFALLRHVGEDCAGAAQFVIPERLDAVLAGDGGVNWLAESEVAEQLRTLRRDPTAWHLRDTGQFSLAGARAKTALHFDPVSGRWGEPWGAVPTTHILKPAVSGLDDHDLNEHLCLAAADTLGLVTAQSWVGSFGGERAIVVRRYDRLNDQSGMVRVHQEDLCQALGRPPTAKYQSEDGPTPEHIIDRLRHSATAADVNRFALALAYQWIIAGTDAHAKNYSVLLNGSEVRLAPLYDVASALPYDDMYPPKLRLAMRVGGEYRVQGVIGRHWRRFADQNGLDADPLLAKIDDLAARAPDAFSAAARDPEIVQLASDLPERLVERVSARAAKCRKDLR